MGRAVIVLARAPSAPGKTRLTAALPPDRAQALRQALAFDTIDVAASSGAQLFICHTPAECAHEFSRWPEAQLIPQRGDDLGARMSNALHDVVARGFESIVLIGSDLPHLPVGHIEDAFARLALGADVVLGPTADGGYYLIAINEVGPLFRGAENRPDPLFGNVAWGTSSVWRETMDRAQAAGLKVAAVGEWFDIDGPDDLVRLRDTAAPWAARRTRQWWVEQADLW